MPSKKKMQKNSGLPEFTGELTVTQVDYPVLRYGRRLLVVVVPEEEPEDLVVAAGRSTCEDGNPGFFIPIEVAERAGLFTELAKSAMQGV